MGITEKFRDVVVIPSKHQVISNTLEGERARFSRVMSSLGGVKVNFMRRFFRFRKFSHLIAPLLYFLVEVRSRVDI